jgi:hypothetical protein
MRSEEIKDREFILQVDLKVGNSSVETQGPRELWF